MKSQWYNNIASVSINACVWTESREVSSFSRVVKSHMIHLDQVSHFV